MRCLSSAQPRGQSPSWSHWLHVCWYRLGLSRRCSRHCLLHQAEPALPLKLFASKILQFAHTRSTPPLSFPTAVTLTTALRARAQLRLQAGLDPQPHPTPPTPPWSQGQDLATGSFKSFLHASATRQPSPSPCPLSLFQPCSKPSDHSDSCHPPILTPMPTVPLLQPAASLAVSSGPLKANNWFQSNAHICSTAPRASQAPTAHRRRAHY